MVRNSFHKGRFDNIEQKEPIRLDKILRLTLWRHCKKWRLQVWFLVSYPKWDYNFIKTTCVSNANQAVCQCWLEIHIFWNREEPSMEPSCLLMFAGKPQTFIFFRLGSTCSWTISFQTLVGKIHFMIWACTNRDALLWTLVGKIQFMIRACTNRNEFVCANPWMSDLITNFFHSHKHFSLSPQRRDILTQQFSGSSAKAQTAAHCANYENLL